MIYFTGEIFSSSPGHPNCVRNKKREEIFDYFMHTPPASREYNLVGRVVLLQLGPYDYGLDA